MAPVDETAMMTIGNAAGTGQTPTATRVVGIAAAAWFAATGVAFGAPAGTSSDATRVEISYAISIMGLTIGRVKRSESPGNTSAIC